MLRNKLNEVWHVVAKYVVLDLIKFRKGECLEMKLAEDRVVFILDWNIFMILMVQTCPQNKLLNVINNVFEC
jgi:hypothetical protein